MPDKWKQMVFCWAGFLNRFKILSDKCQDWQKQFCGVGSDGRVASS